MTGGRKQPHTILEETEEQRRTNDSVLRMGCPLYETILRKIKMRERTLINVRNHREWVIEDDTVLISLSEHCASDRCRVQLLEPKLQKSLMSVVVDKFNNYELAK